MQSIPLPPRRHGSEGQCLRRQCQRLWKPVLREPRRTSATNLPSASQSVTASTLGFSTSDVHAKKNQRHNPAIDVCIEFPLNARNFAELICGRMRLKLQRCATCGGRCTGKPMTSKHTLGSKSSSDLMSTMIDLRVNVGTFCMMVELRFGDCDTSTTPPMAFIFFAKRWKPFQRWRFPAPSS